MKTLVGSQALKTYLPDVRDPKDTDYFTTNPDDVTSRGSGEEVFYHPRLAEWNWQPVATLDELYTIKVSHIFWELRNGTWNKHWFDILTLEQAGATFIPELYAILYPIWEELHGKKKANLEQSPEEFFNANVKRIYEHDSIHNSVAYYDEPLFNRILRDNHEVAVDRNKFEALSHEDKIKLVREEVYATALERKIIPSDYHMPPLQGYMWALQKTITSFTKGWFPLFIVLNALELRRPDVDFVKVHKDNAHKLILL